MQTEGKTVLKIALPVPLRRQFDYLLNESLRKVPLKPGLRVTVPFGKSRLQTGLLLGTSSESDIEPEKLKQIIGLIDEEPLFDKSHLRLLEWAGSYYHYPLGEILFSTMPGPLRRGKPAVKKTRYTWKLTGEGRQLDTGDMKRAPRQAELVQLLKSRSRNELYELLKDSKWRSALKALQEKKLIEKVELEHEPVRGSVEHNNITLNADQQSAVDLVLKNRGRTGNFLLNGITGSGKTEVYIEIIKNIIAAGKQALILVPEIGLTPQLIQRLQSSIDSSMVVLHSSLSDGERLQAWLEARDGTASIVLGTRSAVWTPLKDPGVFIIDEEHDLSYKQQDGFRYSARDVAVMRAKLNNVPVVLGSATPSMESLHNADCGKFISLTLSSRAGAAQHPSIGIIDMRAKKMTGALSSTLVEAITEELQNRRQSLLFLNQRGFSPVIMCHNCGWIAKCKRCDRQMTYHKLQNKYSCHHCNSQARLAVVCPDCGSDELLQIGQGTERLEETLSEIFPNARILRIDRDSTRKKGSMKKMIDAINAGDADILIGTQMLAKGHHFPNLILVGIIDSDRGLFSSDFRASERMVQLFLQVSGRAGRVDKKGKVLIQTHHPQHPLIQSMLHSDYNEFSGIILNERREANLPPFSYLAVLRAEDYRLEAVDKFLTDARDLLTPNDTGLEVHGPLPAILEKRAGRLRYQLIIQSNNRNRLIKTLGPWSRALESLHSAGRVRWSLDVDPQDMT